MTISSTTLRQIYTGDGSNRTFAIPFTYPGSPYTLATSEVEVWTRDESTTPATEALKALTTDYTISSTNIVFGTAPAIAIKIMVRRRVPLTQLLDLLINGSPAPDDQEAAYDRGVMALQQVNEEIGRALKFQRTSSKTSFYVPEPVAGKVLAWAADGLSLVNLDPQSSSNISYTPPASGFTQQATMQAALDALNTRIHGSRASSIGIDNTGIQADGGVLEQVWYVKGNGGPIDLTGVNPQIKAGTSVGQRIEVTGTDNTNTLTIANGTGVIANGSRVLEDGSVWGARWNGTAWQETYFNNL